MRAIILTRDKKAIFENINSKKIDFEFREATYILDPNRVQNHKNEAGQIEGAELIFFEDNPNPVMFETESKESKPNDGKPKEGDTKDLSGKYLNDVVLINVIQQTTDTARNWNPIDLGFITWFFDEPQRIPFILMGVLVAWTLIRDYMAGVLFR